MTRLVKQRTSLALAISLLLVTLPAGAGDAVAEIEAQERAVNAAELRCDFAGLAKLFADDYMSVYSDATVFSKKDFLSWFDKSAPPEKRVRLEVLTTHNESVRVYGEMAVVVGTLHEKGIFMGKPYEARGRFTDVWHREDGQWRLILTHESHFPEEPKA
jgi:ketosteroid isomerase-like protein